MIPENVEIDALARDLEDDAVAMGPETGALYPTLEEELIRVTDDAIDGDFGSLGYVVLDTTPAMTADLRDIAQELLNETSLDTVAVRAPGSGAVVSDIHSRAALESAQHEMLGTTDYVEGASLLIRNVTESGVSAMDWGQVTIWLALLLIAVLVVGAIFTRRRPFGG
ncbi:hypothetical protein CFAEC_07400 [Corynebacterium faecale]|uniref:Rv1476 family membrane protein n=1 Tax=Corynebacterium faecale TaxID=1758466 RepID=UPI0025B403C2|nr:DUF6676 family protein [Corynebacterium faecale]WJY92304.1 hypothetical protein CFAEC_07400 [Corynebacterium faecale]